MHFVGSPATNMARLKRAGRRSIAAQKTFEIVHFLARPGGIAQPAAEFLKHTPGAFAGGNTHRIETRPGVGRPFASRRAPERTGPLAGAKLAWRSFPPLLRPLHAPTP